MNLSLSLRLHKMNLASEIYFLLLGSATSGGCLLASYLTFSAGDYPTSAVMALFALGCWWLVASLDFSREG